MTEAVEAFLGVHASEGAMAAEGMDDAIVGVVERYGMPSILLYDRSKVLAKLEADGMEYEEAIEWYEFNILGAWVGEGTPAFAVLLDSA